ncbi:MAG: glycerol-3-phosphate dehydrogenase [Gammaproteobacteria bacterium]|nr:glycerol-3-phosphate dehydrogenase [Gammaproteobacteria bacterium]
MRRDVSRIAAERYDVIVVGGGIHGTCAAWQAALRGLKVALIESGDFGHATSSNSLRTLHGGLRHLQRLDFRRMRESIRERREWLRLAPHLTRPMRFVLPTAGHGIKGPAVMRTALWVNDMVSFDRNRDVQEGQQLPRGSLWSKSRAADAFAGLDIADCNGAATWYDAVCLNTERLQLAVVAAAVAAGAQAANYVRALRLSLAGSEVCGVHIRDELTDREFEMRAPLVINAAGPWVDEWLGSSSRSRVAELFPASKAFNLLTRPLPFRDAVGLAVQPRAAGHTRAAQVGPQTYFIIPWNGRSLVGTRHLRCDHASRSARVTREEVLEFLADLNQVLGEQRLSGADVNGVFAGLLPEQGANPGPGVALQKSPQVIDHASDGIQGLVSIVGVKWTTARAVGERAARAACRRLRRSGDRPLQRLLSSTTPYADRPLHGGLQLSPDVAAHLWESYGPAREGVLALLAADATLMTRIVPDLPVVLAQIVHAARSEMAVQLSDVVRRRTPLYFSEALDRSALNACASVLARELHWSRREIGVQIDAVEAEMAAFHGPLRMAVSPVAARSVRGG